MFQVARRYWSRKAKRGRGEGPGGGGGRREGQFVRFVSLVHGDQRGGSGGVVDTRSSITGACLCPPGSDRCHVVCQLLCREVLRGLVHRFDLSRWLLKGYSVRRD